MERIEENTFTIKKPVKPTERPITPALLFLRALQLGITYTEAFYLDVGILDDLMTEKSNDGYEYATLGTDADFRKL